MHRLYATDPTCRITNRANDAKSTPTGENGSGVGGVDDARGAGCIAGEDIGTGALKAEGSDARVSSLSSLALAAQTEAARVVKHSEEEANRYSQRLYRAVLLEQCAHLPLIKCSAPHVLSPRKHDKSPRPVEFTMRVSINWGIGSIE